MAAPNDPQRTRIRRLAVSPSVIEARDRGFNVEPARVLYRVCACGCGREFPGYGYQFGWPETPLGVWFGRAQATDVHGRLTGEVLRCGPMVQRDTVPMPPPRVSGAPLDF